MASTEEIDAQIDEWVSRTKELTGKEVRERETWNHGVTADAFTLFERLEGKLDKHSGHLTRACVELAKDWRTDRYLRRLEAMLAVADKDVSLVVTGTGDVLEPSDGLIGIGSGGNYALAAARALMETDGLDAEAIARKALRIAAGICVYTNENIIVEAL